MAMLKISVLNSKELQATILALKTMDKTVSANIRRYTKLIGQPEWQKGLREHALSRVQIRTLADTGRVAVSNQNVSLKSATVGRSLSGGLNPKEDWAAFEFGADRGNAAKRTYDATSRKGKRYTVTRNTRRQLPPRSRSGWVVFPTARELIPRFASLWYQTTIRTLYETFERK